MSKIITDKKKIKELLSRGVDEVINEKDLEKKLKSGKKLRVKLGIDPTSPNIHLGRAIPLLKLKDFQDLGHQIIFIVGDFTGVIGDTSDKELNNNAYQSIITDRRSGLYKDWILPVEMEHHNKTTKNTKCHQVANNPTINMSQTDKNEYSWMFDRSRGITQFPHSTAI